MQVVVKIWALGKYFWNNGRFCSATNLLVTISLVGWHLMDLCIVLLSVLGWFLAMKGVRPSSEICVFRILGSLRIVRCTLE